MATTLTEVAPTSSASRPTCLVTSSSTRSWSGMTSRFFETGYRSMFELVREQVAQVIDPTKIRWIGFSHFEGDECGGLNEWLRPPRPRRSAAWWGR